MFTKLRNRFLILNLVIISIIMLVAFTSIYTITYRDVQRNIHMELNKVTDSYTRDFNLPRGDRPGGDLSMGGPDDGEFGFEGAPPKRSISFMLETDPNLTITGRETTLELEETFYPLALDAAVAENKASGQFELDGSHWTFEILQTSTGYMLVFLDTSSQQVILTNLIYTFAIVALVMLIVIFFTSRFFANRSITPIQEAFDKQKQFIADASHELKTPLTIINTNTDVLLANSEDQIRDQEKWLYYIKSETERMTRLTNDLLYLTEMDDSRAGILYTKFDMSEAVENILLTMEAVMFEKQVHLSYEIEPGLQVTGASEQIKQVVMILLDNAVKYTNEGGSVTLTLKKLQQEVVLSVTNTGEGIAPEHLSRIFDRFYRTDSGRARKQGGYGLGLAIAKSIVEQHKGRIYAKSTVGESTTFYVHLS
ncbi:HAMP domain-containing sensor histidine kinase [Paenibacillus urinalis]|uniref:histidine kinase n=1 Tax=Paenibacillus urinalis TaxID=521520 RepID=A0ABY7XGZ6_9BACL|nr:HAMP domain-containing sensor histidine kinase [Paenibacillus urinalis]WDI02895.1 HAMP domain-containing sensor histidine kinase [Paenibacillus urinalis]